MRGDFSASVGRMALVHDKTGKRETWGRCCDVATEIDKGVMGNPGQEWSLGTFNRKMDISRSLAVCATDRWSFGFAFGETELFLGGTHHSRLLTV